MEDRQPTQCRKLHLKDVRHSFFFSPYFYVASFRSQSVQKYSKIHIQSKLIQIWNTCIPLLLFESEIQVLDQGHMC